MMWYEYEGGIRSIQLNCIMSFVRHSKYAGYQRLELPEDPDANPYHENSALM